MSAASTTTKLVTDAEIDVFVQPFHELYTPSSVISTIHAIVWTNGYEDMNSLRRVLMPRLEQLQRAPIPNRFEPILYAIEINMNMQKPSFLARLRVLTESLSSRALHLLLVRVFLRYGYKAFNSRSVFELIQVNVPPVVEVLLEGYHDSYDTLHAEAIDRLSEQRGWLDACYAISKGEDSNVTRLTYYESVRNFRAWWDATLDAAEQKRDARNMKALVPVQMPPQRYTHPQTIDRERRRGLGLGRELDLLAASYLDSTRTFKDGSSSSSKDTDYMHD